MRRALVLSGGGGNGAFQVGAIRALYDRGITDFDTVVGVSIGALNGALANDPDILEKAWAEVAGHPEKVFKPYFTDYQFKFSWKRTLKNLHRLKNPQSLAANYPMWELIRRYIDLDTLPRHYICGLVSLTDGGYKLVKFPGSEINALKNAILASASVPGFLPPVSVRLGNDFHLCADGGLRSISPIRDLENDFDQVISINARGLEPKREFTKFNILEYLVRSLDIMQSEIFRDDLITYGNQITIQPAAGHILPGAADFSKESITQQIKLGRDCANKTLDEL